MDKTNNRTKRWLLKKASTSEYVAIRDEANLTPLQEQTMDYIVLKKESVVATSLALHISDTTVKRKTREALDKMSRLLYRHFPTP